MKKLRLIGLIAAAVLVLAACGGDEVATDVGVTPAPCADAVNEGNGCIYLGIISDLVDGPFSALGVPLTTAQRHFWQKVNADGGLDGWDVIIREADVRDAGYQPARTAEAYQGLRENVLLLAQSLGTPQTQAILDAMAADDVVAAPATWWSGWGFPTNEGDLGLILESGPSYCLEAMNGVPFMYQAMLQSGNFGDDVTWGAIYFPGDYGSDYLAGAKIAASQLGMGDPLFEHQQVPVSGGGTVEEAVGLMVQHKPDLVVIVTGPTEMAQITGGTYTNGHTVFQVLGASPTWNVVLKDNADLMPLLEGVYKATVPWGPWDTESPGHAAFRAAAAANNHLPNNAYGAGWTWQYPVKALLEQAIADGDLTRAHVREIAATLSGIDYQGILPTRDYDGSPADNIVRAAMVVQADASTSDGLRVISPDGFFTSPIAAAFPLTGPCFVTGG